MPDEAALAFSTAGGAVLGGASRRVEAPILQRVPVDAWAFACWVSRPAIRCCWSLTVVLLPAISSSWSAGESVVSEAAAVAVAHPADAIEGLKLEASRCARLSKLSLACGSKPCGRLYFLYFL